MTIAEPIHLFGIDGEDRIATLQQRVDHRSSRCLQGDGHRLRAHCAWQFRQPGQHLLDAGAAMFYLALANDVSCRIDHADLMKLAA